MRTTSVLSGAALCLVVSACSENIPLQPTTAALTSFASRAAVVSEGDELATVSPELEAMNEQLAAEGSDIRIAAAQLMYASDGYSAVTSTVIIANDRIRGLGREWVKGDPRRGGRTDVTYAFGSNTGTVPLVWNDTRTALRFATMAEVQPYIDDAMSAWRDMRCANSGFARVPVAAGTDPDQVDQIVRRQPRSPNYVQPADVVQAGWQPFQFFRALVGGSAAGDGILGATFPAYYVDANGEPTDIDGNGKLDLALMEIFYNQGPLGTRVWGTPTAPGQPDVDFYSVLTHESGHALGLGHFGKVFVTKKDAVDDGGIYLNEVKFAPRALMNAVYIPGTRVELAGTDNSSFCQIWASR